MNCVFLCGVCLRIIYATKQVSFPPLSTNAVLWNEECAGKAVHLLRVITADYNRMASALAGDPADFTLCIQKKKESTPRSGKQSTAATTPSSSTAKGRQKKSQTGSHCDKRIVQCLFHSLP